MPMKSTSNLVNGARQHDSFTANWAVTHSTSLHNVLDLFFIAWASRTMSENDILKMRERAYIEDKQLAMRCLFWARDVRGWAWERRFFRIIFSSLSDDDRQKYRQFVGEYGRFDDLFKTQNKRFLTTDLIDNLIEIFKDKDKVWLACKWIPRKWIVFETIRKQLKLTPKEFRKYLVANTNVVEQQMSAKKWNEIEYNKIPSQAFHKYKKAFYRNDETRFTAFIEDKPEQIKSWTLFPYQLYQSRNNNRYSVENNDQVTNIQWNNLPNYITGDESFLPMCDVSSSMSWLPMDISVSLWVYLSERNKSVFKDAFITFTSNPTMQYLQGTACQRFNQISWAVGYDTNLQKAFELVLDTAKRNNLKQEDMPTSILVISDMEFNDSDVWWLTNYEAIQQQYETAWYKMPRLVFWNVNGREWNVPVNMSQEWVALISGASPAIMKWLLGWEDFTPIWIMLKTLNSERYEQIK